LELAQVALEPAQPFETGPLDAIACDLCAQAIYWSLLGHRVLADAASQSGDPSRALPRPSFDSLWTLADAQLLARAADDPARVDELKGAVVGKSYLDFAELPLDQRAQLARDLRGFAERLCRPLDTARVELERMRMRRLLRWTPIVVGAAVVLAAAVWTLERTDRLRDLAHGKAWTVSSRYHQGGCTSPDQSCAGGQNYFFHTGQEHGPWLEIDLGAVHSISGLDIRNRTDCCQERAVPLVAQVSVDHLNFQEIARQPEQFLNWKPAFQPVRARWVKLHVPRHSILHLARVRVLKG
jgi:hypothetical protein